MSQNPIPHVLCQSKREKGIIAHYENKLAALTAKAELFDEMRDQLGKSTVVISLYGHDGTALVNHNQDLLSKADLLLRKKEL
jgi:hypothetical protein